MNNSKHLSKRLRLKYNIEKEAKEQKLTEILSKGNQRKKNFTSILTTLYNKETVSIRLKKEQKLLKNLFDELRGKNRKANRKIFFEILLFLDKQKCHKLLKEENYLKAIFQMAMHYTWMQRPFKTWVKKSHNTTRQFNSFLHHCFVKYEMPTFMNSAWFDLENNISIGWFIDIGRGYNLRKCEFLPITVTKKISHYFMQAPADFTVQQALRWAQVIGMGGNEAIANHIISSQLGRNRFVHENFFKTVLHYLIQNAAMLAKEKLHQLIDYLSYTYRNDNTYSIKGRSIHNLIALSDEWHVASDFTRTLGGNSSWDKCGVNEYKLEVPVKVEEEVVILSKIYYLVELLSAQALADEGRKMHHCVGSYASICASKRSAIFSLRLKTEFGQEKRLGTIEVNLKAKSIVQAKAKCNAKISPKAKRVLSDWANLENLNISRFM